MIVLIDNYDSFTYNLVQYIGALEPDIQVIRNDACTLDEIEAMKPDAIVISPGPGKPSDAGICIEAIRYFKDKVPILGVCLGHQAICEAFGGTVSYAKELMHGKSSVAQIKEASLLFQSIGPEMQVARYHSLAAIRESLPAELKVTAETGDGEVMAVEHRVYPVYGLQFHPESVLTPKGMTLIENFLNIGKISKKELRRKNTVIREAIITLAKKQDLTYGQAEKVMDEIMGGEASQIQMASYLTALALKGETIDEITASAAVMRAHGRKLLHDMDVLEIVGTGGDGSNSFNISTTSSLVTAAGGVPVAKHGNRAASSKSGAADVLEALGVKITLEPEESLELLKNINICFLFAQKYHTAMKYVAPVRRELGIRTVFNILGPLSNPAGANMELMGVYDELLVEPLAQVMAKLGVKRGMVVFGKEKLDEISACGPTVVCEINDGGFTSYEITPEQFGYAAGNPEELTGGTPQENAEITKAILSGTEKGVKRNAVCMNAGAALYIAGKADTLEAGVRMAEELIDSGAAGRKLEEFIEKSNA